MKLPSTYTKANILSGMAVYAAGEAIAMLILGQFSLAQMLVRILGMMLLGGTLYALEIPAYFAWIDRRTASVQGLGGQLLRAVLAWVYFNPLWIARHLAFTKIFSGAWSEVSWALLPIAVSSFFWSMPFSLAGNFIVQNYVPEKHRFLASGVISGLHAIYYALAAVWFA
jgi:hypothetical protein